MDAIFTSALRLTVSFWLAGATVALADPALAASSANLQPQLTVNVADLDLQAPASRVTAHRRLHTAALTVCNSGNAAIDEACVDHAMRVGGQAINARVTGQITTR